MPSDHAIKKAPGACDSKGLQNNTNLLDLSIQVNQSNAHSTLAAGIVLTDHVLHSTRADNGRQVFWLDRWDITRFLLTIVLVLQCLKQIGGRL